MPETTPSVTTVLTSRVYNRGARSFIHNNDRVPARSFATVSKDVADLLIARYPDEVVDAGVAQKELNGAQIELAETKSQLAASQARVAELEAQVAALSAPVANAGKRGRASASSDLV
jgi:cell division protein FtsB